MILLLNKLSSQQGFYFKWKTMYDVKHPNICKIKDLEIIKELLSLLLTDMPSYILLLF